MDPTETICYMLTDGDSTVKKGTGQHPTTVLAAMNRKEAP